MFKKDPWKPVLCCAAALLLIGPACVSPARADRSTQQSHGEPQHRTGGGSSKTCSPAVRVAAAATRDKSDSSVEARIKELLTELTLDEKITLLSGTSDQIHIPGIKRLGIPELKLSNGSNGVGWWDNSTVYPAESMLAATFDPELAFAEGRSQGRDARARGVHVLLTPGVDLYRVPQCGRNFEYLGEDPFLSARIAVGFIKGVQSQNVATSFKHFAANDQEILRDSVDTIINERRLQEICLPPFKAAVQEARAWTVMAAYNKVNGEWCTANSYLLDEVLRKQWGFKGILMSDWGAVHDCLGPLAAGTDLEMGKTQYYTADNIKGLLREGKLSQAQIDEHVRRILRMSVSLGFFDRDQLDKSIPLDDPASAAVALRVAREGLVLLKNEGGFLPLARDKIHSLVVLGPNACPTITSGGGSPISGTEPFAAVSVLDALRASAGSNTKVAYIPSWAGPNPTAAASFNIPAVYEPVAVGADRGLIAEYFAGPDLAGSPTARKVESSINNLWGSEYSDRAKSLALSMRWTGKIKVEQTDDYVFACSSNGCRVLLDGKPFFDNWSAGKSGNFSRTLKMEAGEIHDVVVEYHRQPGADANIMFTWGKSRETFTGDEARQIAGADAVVVAVGFNPFLESEGMDRTYDLPAEQVELLKNVSRLNPRTVVVLNAGGNVGMEKWIDGVSALLHAWYPGQNGNTAVAEAIFGDLNFSGRLPDTFEKRFEDSPAWGNYPGSPDNGGRVEYKEGIYVGYRWFDKKNIAPRFPFGFGLSYTSFSMHDLKLTKHASSLEARVQVTNTGLRAGTEIVQLYVRPLDSAIDRPVQELKGLSRVELTPGETREVSIPLSADSFATYDMKSHSWISPEGQYEIAVGASSRDILCSQTIEWLNP